MKLIQRMHPEDSKGPTSYYEGIGESYEDDDGRPLRMELSFEPTPEELGDLRYNFYVHNGLDAVNIAPMEQKWLDNVWKLVPTELKTRYYSIAAELSDEVCDDYRGAVKKAVVDFVLHEPDKITPPKMDSGAQKDPMLRIVPKPWNESFLNASARLAKHLHAFNPVLGYINSVWVAVFR